MLALGLILLVILACGIFLIVNKRFPSRNNADEIASSVIDINREPQLLSIQLKNFDKEIVIEEGFLQYAKIMENLAVQNNLQILVQQSFRNSDWYIMGAIVPPDERSNHLVGHAIDINISWNRQHFNSVLLGNYVELPRAVKNFISGYENAGIRWGGNFSPSDPVHFDDGINENYPVWYDTWFSSLQESFRQLSQNQGRITTQRRLPPMDVPQN